MRHRSDVDRLAGMLARRFGAADVMSGWWPFDQTAYYHREMGQPLVRRMMSFRRLIRQVDLPDIKHQCMEMENTFMEAGKRTMNIDPGYLVASRFILATGKNYSHRVYLDRSIYADLTLLYDAGRFHPLPWTYPDYRQANMLGYLSRVRKNYMADARLADGSEADPGGERIEL